MPLGIWARYVWFFTVTCIYHICPWICGNATRWCDHSLLFNLGLLMCFLKIKMATFGLGARKYVFRTTIADRLFSCTSVHFKAVFSYFSSCLGEHSWLLPSTLSSHASSSHCGLPAATMDMSATSQKCPASSPLTAEARQPTTTVRRISLPCVLHLAAPHTSHSAPTLLPSCM